MIRPKVQRCIIACTLKMHASGFGVRSASKYILIFDFIFYLTVFFLGVAPFLVDDLLLVPAALAAIPSSTLPNDSVTPIRLMTTAIIKTFEKLLTSISMSPCRCFFLRGG